MREGDLRRWARSQDGGGDDEGEGEGGRKKRKKVEEDERGELKWVRGWADLLSLGLVPRLPTIIKEHARSNPA